MDVRLTLLSLAAIICVGSGVYGTNSQSCSGNSPKFIDSVLRLAVLLAKNDLYNDAMIELQRLQNYASFIPTVLEQLSEVNPKNSTPTLGLLDSICCTGVTNDTKWFMEILNQGNSTDMEFAMFSSLLSGHRCSGIDELRAPVGPCVYAILDKWTSDIRNGKYDHIYTFMKTRINEEITFLPQITTLVKRAMAHGDANSFNSTINFVKGLPLPEAVIRCYSTIIKELKRKREDHSEEMVQVGYWVHHLSTTRSADNVSLENAFQQLKNEIPLPIQNVFSKTACTLKIIAHNEYLEAIEPNDYLDVFTKGKSSQGHRNQRAEWTLQPHLKSGQLFFTVRNKDRSLSNFVLCETDANFSKVGLCNIQNPKYPHMWTLKPRIAMFKTAFKLKNLETGKYLKTSTVGYAAQRYVDSDPVSSQDTWDIQCF